MDRRSSSNRRPLGPSRPDSTDKNVNKMVTGTSTSNALPEHQVADPFSSEEMRNILPTQETSSTLNVPQCLAPDATLPPLTHVPCLEMLRDSQQLTQDNLLNVLNNSNLLSTSPPSLMRRRNATPLPYRHNHPVTEVQSQHQSSSSIPVSQRWASQDLTNLSMLNRSSTIQSDLSQPLYRRSYSRSPPRLRNDSFLSSPGGRSNDDYMDFESFETERELSRRSLNYNSSPSLGQNNRFLMSLTPSQQAFPPSQTLSSPAVSHQRAADMPRLTRSRPVYPGEFPLSPRRYVPRNNMRRYPLQPSLWRRMFQQYQPSHANSTRRRFGNNPSGFFQLTPHFTRIRPPPALRRLLLSSGRNALLRATTEGNISGRQNH